jgi:hypothetical protein
MQILYKAMVNKHFSILYRNSVSASADTFFIPLIVSDTIKQVHAIFSKDNFKLLMLISDKLILYP